MVAPGGARMRSSLPAHIATPRCYLRVTASSMGTLPTSPASERERESGSGRGGGDTRGGAPQATSQQLLQQTRAPQLSTRHPSGAPPKGVSDLLVWHPGSKGGWFRGAGEGKGVTSGGVTTLSGVRSQALHVPPVGGGAVGGGGGGEGGRFVAGPHGSWPPPPSLAPPFLAVVGLRESFEYRDSRQN